MPIFTLFTEIHASEPQSPETASVSRQPAIESKATEENPRGFRILIDSLTLLGVLIANKQTHKDLHGRGFLPIKNTSMLRQNVLAKLKCQR